MSRRRVAVLVVAGVVLAVLVVAIGRWERTRSARYEVQHMQAVMTAIGDLHHRRPTGYRVGPPDCLAYATPGNLYGLQICFDAVGRVVETVDRRGSQPKYASLWYDPSLSTLRVPRSLVDRLLAIDHIPQSH